MPITVYLFFKIKVISFAQDKKRNKKKIKEMTGKKM